MTRVEFTKHAMELLVFAFENGIPLLLDYAKRSPAEQQKLFDEGRSKTLKSRHVVGKAIDVYIVDKKGDILWDSNLYKVLASFWKTKGKEFRWGGDFKGLYDPYHFEVTT